MSSKRLLQISYYFPPIKTVGTLRNHRIYQSFKKEWGTVHVLTTSNRKRLLADPLSVDERDISEIPTLDVRRLLAGIRPKKNHLPASRKKKKAMRFLLRLADSFPFSLLLADGGPLYILRGYQKGSSLVRREGITHLYSSFRPYADHLIAWLLKRRFPHLFWMADFRDLPLDMSGKSVLFPTLQARIHQSILKRADLISTVSKGLAGQLSKYSPETIVLYNALPEDPDHRPSPALPASFTITYTGSLYPGRQSARPLFKLLARWLEEGRLSSGEICLRYAGKDADIWLSWIEQHGLQGISRIEGLLPYTEAKALQESSHINLLLSWFETGSEGILTGKLFHYLRAGRPIVALSNGGPDPELQEILAGAPGSSIFTDQDEETLAKYLEEKLKKWREGSRSIPAPDFPEKYSWEKGFKALLQRIAGSGPQDLPAPERAQEAHADPEMPEE